MITIEKEIWKPVRGFEEYAEISNFGQIHRFERVYYAGRNHKIKRNQEEDWTYGSYTGGYLYAKIGGVSKGVHVWVYLTFVGDIPKGLEVNHIDEDKHNNCVWNLNLMTPKENCNWGTRNKRAGEKVAAALRGKPKSPESIAKKSAAQTNHPNMSKAVQALNPKTLEVVMEFPSTREAGRQGFDQSAVGKCCRNCFNHQGNNVYKGYIWRYADI